MSPIIFKNSENKVIKHKVNREKINKDRKKINKFKINYSLDKNDKIYIFYTLKSQLDESTKKDKELLNSNSINLYEVKVLQNLWEINNKYNKPKKKKKVKEEVNNMIGIQDEINKCSKKIREDESEIYVYNFKIFKIFNLNKTEKIEDYIPNYNKYKDTIESVSVNNYIFINCYKYKKRLFNQNYQKLFILLSDTNKKSKLQINNIEQDTDSIFKTINIIYNKEGNYITVWDILKNLFKNG